MPASADARSCGRLDARLKTIVWSVKTLLGVGLEPAPTATVMDMIASYQGTGYRPESDRELASAAHASALFCAS
jgi:hypothetical protein